MLKEIYRRGAHSGPVFGFLASKYLLDVFRFPLEIALLSPWIAVMRYVITLPFAFIIGLIATYIPRKTMDSLIEQGTKQMDQQNQEGC